MTESSKMYGKQTILFDSPPYILGHAAIGGKKEGEGPLAKYFDLTNDDPMFGKKTWEEAESELQRLACDMALKKAGLTNKEIRYLFGGDLLGQLIATSFGIVSLDIPLFGIYGACSTMGEGLSLAAMMIDGGFADKTMAVTSSHFAGAEKQFRFPLTYGSQRPYSATWTVTGSGATILGKEKTKNGLDVVVTGVTTGKVIDYGVKDSTNMGACMAPAASDVIYTNLQELDRKPEYYDKIITGDLGTIGREITLDILKEKGYDISKQYMDCGIEIFDPTEQDTHAGGSGCGCSATTFNGYILEMLKRKQWNRVLFVPTGSLQSPTSFNEGQSVPGIAHGVILETV